MVELLIDVPPLLHPCLQWLSAALASLSLAWIAATDHISAGFLAAERLLQIPRNALIPISAILLVFWPVLLSLVVALATAWTWIFWLLTSIVFGFVQLGYVTYQFVMIAGDIAGLSMLKTYSMLRSQCLALIDYKLPVQGSRKGRRRQWRQRLEEANDYEDFLKIRIQNKQDDALAALVTTRAGVVGPAKIPRAHSFSLDDSPTRHMKRNRSFSGEAQLASALTAHIDPVAVAELGERTADLLSTTTTRLFEARLAAEVSTTEESIQALQYLLSGVTKRNHLQLDDLAVENARNIAGSGEYGLTAASRQLIRRYYDEVEKGLDWIAEAPLVSEQDRPPSSIPSRYEGLPGLDRQHEILDRIMLVRKMKQNMGRTALMLSGGGAQAMYHLGIIRALIESKQYADIKVISGTSGGSITAAMCAIMNQDELHKDVCVRTVSTDFRGTGEMKAKNIRWFPTIMEMGAYWLKHKLMVDSAEFRRTCEFYFSDITFEEAFEMTGKHVCITVSASRASGYTAQRLLLNHISTPHVTVASAVAASCALPGVMAPAKLIAKSSSGVLEPFEVDGVEWIDGSVQADLPFQRIATLFAVSSFIVSQCNFHVVPFLNKAHHPNLNSLYWRLFQTMEWDIRNRALKLSRLGLFPRIFGQDISKVFKQRYHGNLTIVPRFTMMQTFGLQALSNPTVKDMEHYLKYGQIATWPYLNAIRDMMRLEKALDDCLNRLEDRMRTIAPDADWSMHDDIDSIASSSVIANSSSCRVKIVGRPPIGLSMRDRETERLRKSLNTLEKENTELRKQLEELKRIQKNADGRESRQEQNDADGRGDLERSASLSEGSEGQIWGLVLRRKRFGGM